MVVESYGIIAWILYYDRNRLKSERKTQGGWQRALPKLILRLTNEDRIILSVSISTRKAHLAILNETSI